MLSTISDIHELSRRLSIDVREFPPFYYNLFYPSSSLIFFLKEKEVVPVKFSKHLFLKNAQFQFYPLKENNRMNVLEENAFIGMVIDHITEHNMADRILPSPNYVIFNSFPINSVHSQFGTYYLDLSLPVDQIWNNIHPKHKNKIRSAKKSNCSIVTGDSQLDVFFEMYRETMNRSSLNCYPIGYFKQMIKKENVLCAIVYYGDTPQGGLLMPYSKYGAYYLYGATATGIEIPGANNYLHWEIIKLMKQNNVRVYDFVGARLSDVSGSKLSGIQMFKERFGSVLQKGYLWKVDLNYKCFIYDFLAGLKNVITLRTNKFVDIIDQENKKE